MATASLHDDRKGRHYVSSQYLGVAEAERVNQVMEKTHLPAFHVGQKGACIESPV